MGLFKYKSKEGIKEIKGTLIDNKMNSWVIETEDNKIIMIPENNLITGINTFKKELYNYITENEVYPDSYYYISKCRPALLDNITSRKYIGKWLAYELIETSEPLTEDIINEWELIPMQ